MRSIWSGADQLRIGTHSGQALHRGSGKQPRSRHAQETGPLSHPLCAGLPGHGRGSPLRGHRQGIPVQEGRLCGPRGRGLQRASVRKTQTIDIVEFVDAGRDRPEAPRKALLPGAHEAGEEGLRPSQGGPEKNGESGGGEVCPEEQGAPGGPEARRGPHRARADALRRRDQESRAGLDLPGKEEASDRELEMAIKLIDQLTEPFKPEQFHDTYREELERWSRRRPRGSPPEPVEAAAPYPKRCPTSWRDYAKASNRRRSERRRATAMRPIR